MYHEDVKMSMVWGRKIWHWQKSEGDPFVPLSVWSANGLLHPPPIQNRACELLRTRLLCVQSHLIEIPSRSNLRIRSLSTVISASHSSWEYPSGCSLSDFFSCFLGVFFSMIVFVSLECRSSWQWRCRSMRLLSLLLLWFWSM